MACLQSWVSEEDFGCPTIPCPNCGRPFPVSRAAREECLVAVRGLLAKNCTAFSRCKTSSVPLRDVGHDAKVGHAEDPPKKRHKKQSSEEEEEPRLFWSARFGALVGLHDLDQVQKEREAAGLPPPRWEANTWLKKNGHKYMGGEADAQDPPKKRKTKQSRKKLVGESSDEGPPLVPRQMGYVFGREGWHDLDQVQKEREAAGLPPPWWERKRLEKQLLEKGGEADAEDGPSCSSSTSASMVCDSVKPMCNSEAEADVWF